MSGLSFSQTKGDVKRLFELKERYAGIIRPGITSTNKQLREIAEKMEKKSMNVREFLPGYDKREFYSMIGEFFAERRYRKEMPYLVNDDDKSWNIFFDGSSVVGFYSYVENKGVTEISGFYVLDRCRGTGIGTEMLNDITRRFHAIKMVSNSPQMISMLERHGFLEIGVRGSYKILERRDDR